MRGKAALLWVVATVIVGGCGSGSGESPGRGDVAVPPERAPDPKIFPPALRALGLARPVPRYQAPGASLRAILTVRLGHRPLEVRARARITLLELKRHGREAEGVVSAQTTPISRISESRPFEFKARVPAKRGRYALTLEFIRRGRAIDRYATYFEVPDQRVRAMWRLERPTVGRGARRLRGRLANRGPVPISFGADYRIQRRRLDRWVEVKLDVAFPLYLAALAPGKSRPADVYLPEGLAPGKYRAVKQVKGIGTNIQLELRAGFEVR